MIDSLCRKYGPCIKLDLSDLGSYSGEWYFLSITPRPETNEINAVISDLLNGDEISMSNGRLMHSSQCVQSKHYLPKDLREVAKTLRDETFLVAIFNSPSETYGGQPLAICIDPEVSYTTFPMHPHLNSPLAEVKPLFPATLCYTDRPRNLGEQFDDRIFEAMFHVTGWLLRHQIWKAYLEKGMQGVWIGPHAKGSIPDSSFPFFINPKGRCRCGSRLLYFECCMQNDLNQHVLELNRGPIATPVKLRNPSLNAVHQNWLEKIEIPEKDFIAKLRYAYNESRLQLY